jgi:hypothetical protein
MGALKSSDGQILTGVVGEAICCTHTQRTRRGRDTTGEPYRLPMQSCCHPAFPANSSDFGTATTRRRTQRSKHPRTALLSQTTVIAKQDPELQFTCRRWPGVYEVN